MFVSACLQACLLEGILFFFSFFFDSSVKLSGILRASQLHRGCLTVSLRARQSDSMHRLIGSSACRTVRSHFFSRGGCVAVLHSLPSPQPLRCFARLCLRVASSRPSLLLSLRISSFLCHFVFSLISAPPSSTSSALSLSIPFLLHVPPHPADGRLNKITGVDQTPNLARAGPRGDKGKSGKQDRAR